MGWPVSDGKDSWIQELAGQQELEPGVSRATAAGVGSWRGNMSQSRALLDQGSETETGIVKEGL